MPELPEVETIRQGLLEASLNRRVDRVITRCKKLREPVTQSIKQELETHLIIDILRRGKYLLFRFKHGTLIVHLGMTGYFKIVPPNQPIEKHDHIDLIIENNICLRYNDTRRFGLFCWTSQPFSMHQKLVKLGVEPLTKDWNSDYLFKACHNRQCAIKILLMNHHIVVGIGNIYANETLFLCGIHPKTPAKAITAKQAEMLVQQSRLILKKAITAGGTTLKDFRHTDGKAGYFKQQLFVYGRNGKPCLTCQSPLKKVSLGQRATYYCLNCQPCLEE